MERSLSTNQLCKFIRRLIEGSSQLEVLEVVTDPAAEAISDGPLASFDALVRHLLHKHANTLTNLSMPMCFVGKDLFAELIRRCAHLEVLRLAVRLDCFVSRSNFIRAAEMYCLIMYQRSLDVVIAPACRLRDLELNVVHTKRSKVIFCQQFALQLFRCGASSLRRVVINGHGWKVSLPLSLSSSTR